MSSPHFDPVAVIDCDTAVRRLWDYLDAELDAPRFAEVEQHLAACAECSEHVSFSRAFLRAVHEAAAPAALSEETLRQRVLARLAAEGFRTP
ncbi:MAG: zf-HC2 domain-containing protein [Gemmatimonadaceae bacterium]|nr:zf-HC2 domain-containing protein [Gemmatimonadaceae bacterium]